MAVEEEDTNRTITTTLPAVDQNILATAAVAAANHPMHDLIVSFPNQSLQLPIPKMTMTTLTKKTPPITLAPAPN